MKKLILLYLLFTQVTVKAQQMHDAYGVLRKGHQGTDEEMKYPEKYLKKNMKVSVYLGLHKDNIVRFLVDSLKAEEDGEEGLVFTLDGIRCHVGPIDTAYSRDLIENYCHVCSPRFTSLVHTSYHDLCNKTYEPFDRNQYDPAKTGDGWERFSYFRLKDMPLCDNCYKLNANHLFFDRSAYCYNPAEMFQRATGKQKSPPVAKVCDEPDKYWQEDRDEYRYFYKRVNCTDIFIRKEKIPVEHVCNLADSFWKETWRDRGIRYGVRHYRIQCELISKSYHRSWLASNWGYFAGGAIAGGLAWKFWPKPHDKSKDTTTYAGGYHTPPMGNDTSYGGGYNTPQLKGGSTSDGSGSIVKNSSSKGSERVDFLDFERKPTQKFVPLYTPTFHFKLVVTIGLDNLLKGKFSFYKQGGVSALVFPERS
jgi:hypothetical protein